MKLTLLAPIAFLCSLVSASPIDVSPNPLAARQWGGVACDLRDWNCYCYYYPGTQACRQRSCPPNDWQCYCWNNPGARGCQQAPPQCDPRDWRCFCYTHPRDPQCRPGGCRGPWDRDCCFRRWDRNCCDWRDNRDPRCRWGGHGGKVEETKASA